MILLFLWYVLKAALVSTRDSRWRSFLCFTEKNNSSKLVWKDMVVVHF